MVQEFDFTTMANNNDEYHNGDSPGASITVATFEPPISPPPRTPDHTQPAETTVGLDGTSEEQSPRLGPRRGSFPSDLPEDFTMPKKPVIPEFPNLMRRKSSGSGSNTATVTKDDIQPALSASLAPKSGILPSQRTSPHHIVDQQTDSDPEYKHSKPMTQSAPRSASYDTPTPSAYPAAQSMYSTMQFATPDGQMPPPPREPKTSARRVKNYTLSDGTVVSGKGLGRGRPGIKRGPRNPKYKLEEPKVTGEIASPGATSESPTLPPSSQPSRKRKRAISDAFSASSSATSDSRDSSPEYNPTGATRSGRLTQKPTAAVVQPSESASPAVKRPKVQSANSTPNIAKTHPKIKRRVYRGREQFALCEHCLRGHGPVGNVIVFCDACNKCWHQRCHDPQIPQSIVTDSKAEWYCADCDRILHGKKNKKVKAATINLASPVVDAAPTFTGPIIGGATLTHAQKSSYLQSLTKDRLVSLILSASELAPALPMFQAPAPVLPAAKFVSSYTTPVSATPVYHTAAGAAEADGEEDEGYETYVDEHALLYPKPGQGIKLPPEKDDMRMLLEGKESRTFSHWVQGREGGREFSGTGDVAGVGNGTHGHGHGHAQYHGNRGMNGINGQGGPLNHRY